MTFTACAFSCSFDVLQHRSFKRKEKGWAIWCLSCRSQLRVFWVPHNYLQSFHKEATAAFGPAGLPQTTGVLVHCAQGLCFCYFLKASPSMPAALQDLALSPPIRVKPLPLHMSSSFHTGACRRPLMLQWLQFHHQLSEKAFLERVYYVSSNKELYFHHRFSCPRLSALWLGVSSMRAIWYNG